MQPTAFAQFLGQLAGLAAQEDVITQAALASVVGPALEAARSDPAFASEDLASLLQRAGDYLARIQAGTAGVASTSETASPPSPPVDLLTAVGDAAHDVNNALTFLLPTLQGAESELRAQGNAALADDMSSAHTAAQRIREAMRSLQRRTFGDRTDLPAPSAAQAAASQAAPTALPVLLIVDDEPALATAAKRLLAESGFKEILTALSAEEALTLLDQRPDIGVVLTDHKMPRKFGLELAREIRRKNPRIAVVIYSGNQNDIKLTPDDRFPIVEKPFEKPVLEQALMAEFRRLQAAAPPAPAAAAAAIAGALLLVDDDRDVLEIISASLREAGVTVHTAENADAALTVFDANPDIRVVMTDLRMEGSMDGLGLIRELRKRRGTLRFLLATGFDRQTISQRLEEGDEVTIVPKPFDDVGEVIGLVRRTLQEPAG